MRTLCDVYTVTSDKGVRFLATREITGTGRPRTTVWALDLSRVATKTETANVRAMLDKRHLLWSRAKREKGTP